MTFEGVPANGPSRLDGLTAFPSLDFSLVYVLNERGETGDMFIEKRGAKSAPARTIPAASKAAIDLPEHLEVRPGRIDNLEATLIPASVGAR